MNNPQNLAYSSDFNYQKIAVEGSVDANIGASITSPTNIKNIVVSEVPDISIWRVFIKYSSKVYELTYFDTITNAWLYSYASGSSLNIMCDQSVGAFSATFYYRIYVNDGS